MPLLDVAFMVLDPRLADTFDVRRRTQAGGANGRVYAVPDEVYTDQVGVVTQQDPAAIVRSEDGAVMPRMISIATQFQFVALGPNQQPDEVLWNGALYTVTESLPYSRFGEGF